MLLIDVVITWVKSGDSGWLKEKELIKKKEKELIKNKLIEDSKSRYPPTTGNENDYETELYYTMLSCVLYLPFIRKIVLVTARPHVPTFILDFGPLVKVVHHDEFIPLTKLPTFNSRAIEAHFAHITDLSETFIYLNDDMMYGSSIPASYYFSEDGRPIVRTTKRWDGAPCLFHKLNTKTKTKTKYSYGGKGSAYTVSNRYVNMLLNGTFKEADRGLLLHHGTPLCKSMFLLAETYFPNEWAVVQDSRIRSSGTITPIPLTSYVGVYENKALLAVGDASKRLEWHSAVDTNKILFAKLLGSPPPLLCINDIGDQLPKNKIKACFSFFKQFYRERVDKHIIMFSFFL